MNRRLLDYLPEMEFLAYQALPARRAPGQHQNQNQVPNQAERQRDQQASMAAGLLEVSNEAELGQFLCDLVRAGGAFAPVAAHALVRVLKRVALPVFPLHGSALASGLDDNRSGADLTATAARVFGLELEGLSPEDKEFEVACQFIRLASDAIENSRTNARLGEPQAVAERALQHAAQRHAPGLLQMSGTGDSGRWQRQGRRIIVFNC
ncbi:MAG: hypothetical protein ACI83P_001388 [Janthinobacterium sp.]|jgi:hypothetical protein